MRTRLVIPAALLVAAAYVSGRQRALEASRRPAPAACEISDEIRRRAEAEAADSHEFLGEPSPFATPAAERSVVHAGGEAAATTAPPAPSAYITGRVARSGWDVPEFPLPVTRVRTGSPAPVTAPVAPVAAVADTVAPAVERTEATSDIDIAVLSEWAAPTASAVVAPAPAPSAPVPAEDGPSVLSEWATHVVAASRAVPVADPLPLDTVEVEVDESGRFSIGGWATQAGHLAFAGVTFRDRRAGHVAPGDVTLVADGLDNVSDGGLMVLGDAGFAPDAEGFTLVVAAAAPGAFAATGRYELRVS